MNCSVPRQRMDNKKLNVFDLTSIGVGTIIGAGLFSMLGYGIAYTGRGIVIALFLAMALVVLQSIRYPILANVFELDGGMYAYNALTCPRVCAGFTAAQDVFFKLGTQSVTVLAFAMYLEMLFPALIPYRKLVAILVLTVTYICVIAGTKFAARVQNGMCISNLRRNTGKPRMYETTKRRLSANADSLSFALFRHWGGHSSGSPACSQR